ncbi:protein BIG GRAIN 1-like B [Impatiens glandulifera]|uniref:protein BIG GRAIN 1-like B n=1 Tax=Impatiens glandulifera TaxID=253017 RepID=UPI001FB07E3E|nr:protein BIG GRAIN 1-like B [Impatiens glandulifera]
MFSWEKSVRGDKSKKHQANPPLSSTLPSFSSTLLDEIYHSIDAGTVKRDGLKLPRDRLTTREQINDGTVTTTTKIKKPVSVKDEETDNRRRAYRVEKWMENKVHHDKISTRRRQSLPDYDRTFFTSSWSSSDSSSGGETESPAMYKPRSSCFTGAPISVRTSTNPTHSEKTPKYSKHTSNKSYPFDSRNEDIETKSKLSALKMYNNLKKVKQPISPGIRLTSFLNSLFSHGNGKKTKQRNEDDVVYVERRSKPAAKQTSTSSISACSSSSSYYRSCLTNKTGSSVKEKKPVNNNNNNNNNNIPGAKRTVRFDPVSVIVDEDDAGSDASSDLFELDHLAFMGSYDNIRDYNQELPVYETTRVGSIYGRRIHS